MGEEEAPKSKREVMLENLKRKYADRGFENEDDYWGAAMEGYDAEHDYAKRMREDNQSLRELLDSDPDFEDFVREIGKGEDISDAVRHMPSDVLDFKSEDDGRRGERAEMLRAEQRHREELEQMLAEQQENLAKSEQSLREYITNQGLSEEEGQELMTLLQTKILEPIGKGLISPELLEMMDKGRHYDEDMKQAERAGRVAGRNEQIIERRERLDHGLDGLPSSGRGGEVGGEGARPDPTRDYFRAIRGRQESRGGYDDFYNQK